MVRSVLEWMDIGYDFFEKLEIAKSFFLTCKKV